MDWSERERQYWIAALVLVVLIYSTLYFVRGPVEVLRAHGFLRLTVGAVFGVAAVALGWLIGRRGFGPREGLALLGFVSLFGGAVLLAERPEEKLHFLEYGLLGAVIFEACKARAARLGRGSLVAAIAAAVLTGLAGWGDELIQAILPNRYYDLRDVVWNVLGSTIVILALSAVAIARRRDSRF